TAEFGRKELEADKQNLESWSGRPWTERVALVRKAADMIEKRQFYLAALITYEVGKNRYEAIAEVNEAADMLRYYARVMEENHGYVRPMDRIVSGENSKCVLRSQGVWSVVSRFS